MPGHVLAALVAAPLTDLQRRIILLVWTETHGGVVPCVLSHEDVAVSLDVKPSGHFRNDSAALAKAGVLLRRGRHLSVQPDPEKWGAYYVKPENRCAALRFATEGATPGPEPTPTALTPVKPPAGRIGGNGRHPKKAEPKERRKTYIDRFIDLHFELFGSILTHKECGHALKLLVERHGEESIQTAYRRYADENKGERWCGFHNFARYVDRYLEANEPEPDYRQILE